jgi:hypothetical protein
MLCAMKMFGCVLVLGGIAASDVSAFKAEPQVDPGIALFYAFFANMRFRACDPDLTEMRALCHGSLREVYATILS